MKGNTTKILIGAVVIAVLILGAAYKFFYSEDIAKAESVQNEINTLQVRVDELNQKNANRPMYEAGITESDDIIDTILTLYGPGNTPEKTIMLVVDMCNKIGIKVPNVSFMDDSRVFASEAQNENGEPKIQIFKSGMALSVNGGYTQIKKLMDYINSYPERMNVENFTESFDSNSGRLVLTMNVNMYSVKDDNHVYEAPVVEDIEIGSTNIFRTMEIATEEEVVEGEEGTEGGTETGTPEDTNTVE